MIFKNINLKNFLIVLFFITTNVLFSQVNKIKIPPSQGFVSDFAKVLSQPIKLKIEEIVAEVEQKTSAEIAVVTVNDLSGTTIEDYSVKLFENWGIGKRDKNNGILFITVVNDKKVRIEVGYGLEGAIPDGLAGEILDKYVLPNYKNNDFDKGMLLGTILIAQIIAKEYNITLSSLNSGQVQVSQLEKAEKPSFSQIVFSIILMIFVIYIFIKHPILFFILLSSRGGGFGRGGFGGGGFGGFGGGISGGGGASRGW